MKSKKVVEDKSAVSLYDKHIVQGESWDWDSTVQLFSAGVFATTTAVSAKGLKGDVGEYRKVVGSESGSKTLYRKISKAEYDTTMKTRKLQGQIRGKDSSKWLSESYEKVKAFHNKAVPSGTEEFIVEFNMTDNYMEYLRQTAIPQSKGLTSVKFYYEGLEPNGAYRNYGITAEEGDTFNNNINSVIRK